MIAGLGAGLAVFVAVWVVLSTPTPRVRTMPRSGRRVRAIGPRWRRGRKVDPSALAELAGTLQLLASALDAGLPLRRALVEVTSGAAGTTAAELREVLARIDVGTPEHEAWRAVGDHDLLAPVAREVARSLGSGTALAATFRRHADDLWVEQEAAAQTAARAVGVRSVLPLMVCFLPAFLLVGVVPVVAGVALKMFG